MFNNKIKMIEFEKNSDFVERVLLLSLPPAFVFLALVSLSVLSVMMAILSYAAIILFYIILLFPVTFELQRIKNYISSLASGEEVDIKDINLSEQESKEIAKAINKLHKFWIAKNDALTAQNMSDAAVLDTLPDPILVINKNQDILGANLSARTLLGEDIAGNNIKNIFSSEPLKNAINRVANREEDSENVVFYIDEQNKHKMYAHIKQLPWFSIGQSEIVISIYDLLKVTKIEKIQSDFVANASHELRTPLSVISGFIETLQTTAKDDKEAQEMFLKIMKEQADYMSSLIENLLSLSKIEMSEDINLNDKVVFNDILSEVGSSLMLKLKNKNMKIKITGNKKNGFIMANLSQIKQVLHNLIDNAIKYGDEKSEIVVTIKEINQIPSSRNFEIADGKAVAISINNQGEPIKPENIERLTERFYRLQEHKNQNIKGTGLGLSIVKQIIVRHKGSMNICSDEKNGTTFTVYLPENIA